ncbi:MAG: SusD/RagB family nutrient-binding outer membrane lipoprotein [Chitinophagaceae bacterium]|nr:SusD/RagB family nutrient-binding outer membrane lipoprotein [Chitinophagaceae bacterium]
MKKLHISFLKFAFVIMSGSLVTSCSKLEDFGDTNVNPNGSSQVLTSALISNVTASLGGLAAQLQPGLYCQYFAEPTYPGSSLYTLPQINSSGTYSGSLMDCQLIINKNTDPATSGLNSVTSGGAAENQIAIAKIAKAYIYWTLTDRWGDLPYSEALKGVSVLNPKYDLQEDIYKGILADLKDAVYGFDDTKPTAKGDVIFSGDIAKWRKTANSLRMLIALRMSKKYPNPGAFAASQFADAVSDPYGHITSNADNFTLVYPGGNYRNPWNTAGASTDNGVAKTFTDALGGLNDTRLSVMASNSNGVAYGLTAAAPTTPAFALILAPSARQDNSPLVIVSAASVWLAKAEAIELGWIAGDSKVAYDNGVTASFAQWNVTLPSTYLTTSPANFDGGVGVASIGGSTVIGSNASTPNKLARIALQQWIAYYPDGLQGWSNWRKSEGVLAAPALGVPDIRPTVNAKSLSGKIVRRYVYGVSEYNLNGEKLSEAISNIPGGDDQDSRVWWDRN